MESSHYKFLHPSEKLHLLLNPGLISHRTPGTLGVLGRCRQREGRKIPPFLFYSDLHIKIRARPYLGLIWILCAFFNFLSSMWHSPPTTAPLLKILRSQYAINVALLFRFPRHKESLDLVSRQCGTTVVGREHCMDEGELKGGGFIALINFNKDRNIHNTKVSQQPSACFSLMIHNYHV